jgi:uncharacterized PurR-regulated membrane protein YhhQ (DUF165 family)
MNFAQRGVLLGVLAMTVVVTASNVLVQHPINDYLTWAAFTYPVAFLVTDLSNRCLGPQKARQVVLAGFVVAIVFSALLATPRIAFASASAFLFAQLLDIFLFNRLRRGAWWRAPFISSTVASALDTALFFGLAFAGTAVPWVTLAIGDYAMKLAMALVMLIPFRALLPLLPSREPQSQEAGA